jgi:hypothetical protein
MARDAIVLISLVVAVASLVTAHVMLAFGLARRSYGWRALLAFILVPLAPWWGWREKMRVRSVLWLAAAITYVVTLPLALR